MITEQEYLEWLNKPNKNQVLLAIVTGWNSTQNIDFYFSSKAYYTAPTDTIPNIQFKPVILGNFSFKRSINFFNESKSRDDFGLIEIDNSNHEFDNMISFQFFHRPIKILFGDPSWSFDDFLAFPLLEGVIDKFEFSNKISFKIKNKVGILDKPIQENLISSTNKSDNNPTPITYGIVENITPILIDTNNHIYQWNDGEADQVTNVYDRGVLLTIGVNYTVDNPNGKITLTTRPAGTITLDGNGVKTTTHLKKTGDIIKHIISPYFSGEIDISSFNNLDIEKPYDVGIYIEKRENILDIIERLLTGINAYYFINRAGQFSVGHLKNPLNEIPILTIGANKIELKSLSIKKLNNIQWRTKINYQKNWTIQKDGDLAGVITDPGYPNQDRVDFLNTEYRTAKYEDLSVVPNGTEFDLVADPNAIESFLVNKSDAITEATFVQSILGQQVYLINFVAKDISFSLKPGDIIKIYDEVFNRFGLGNGVNIQILSINQKIINLSTDITGFFIYE